MSIVGDIATQIRHAVEALSTNSQNQGRRLRELLDESPAVFQQVVAAMLASARDTPELRYVIALLSARGLLVPMLRELSSKDRGAAGVVAQLAQRMDPAFDRVMARAPSDAKTPLIRTRPDPEFLLGLLDALSGGLCLLPMLAPLRQSEDPQIRARLSLLLGRITTAHDWFQALQADHDPLVRANVIESLWSVGGEFSAECFARGLNDPHHQVVANSLVGLYLLGATSAVSGLVEMAQHPDEQFRAAASSAMGRTGDSRFLPILNQLRRGQDQDLIVIRSALQALVRINLASAGNSRRETRVSCLRLRPNVNEELDAVLVAHDKDPGPLPFLRATDWQVRVNGEPVWSYQADFVAAAPSLTLCLALPTAQAEDGIRRPHWEAAMRTAALWRRPNDRFAASFYSESAASHFQSDGSDGTTGASPTRPGAARKLPADPLAALTTAVRTSHPVAALQQLNGLLDGAGGDQHMILILDAIAETRCDLTGLPALLTKLQQHNSRLHCLVTGRAAPKPAAAFRQLALQTGGYALDVPELDDLTRNLQALIASLFGHFHLRCPLAAGAQQVEIELQAEGHQGTLALAAGELSGSSQVAA